MTSKLIAKRQDNHRRMTIALICGAALISASAHAVPLATLKTNAAHPQPLATPKTKAAHPQPIAPAFIHHPPGATNLAPGLNTNPNNDPTPAAFQYGTGSDPFNGETGEGSGPESTRRTAAIHNNFVSIAATKRTKAAATPIPPGKLKATRIKPAQAVSKK